MLPILLLACAVGDDEPVCVDIIEVDALWTVDEEGFVVYEGCFDCTDTLVCTVASNCCPPGWEFLAPGRDRLTVLCEVDE